MITVEVNTIERAKLLNQANFWEDPVLNQVNVHVEIRNDFWVAITDKIVVEDPQETF